MRTLVTGGIRSGKSATAEGLMGPDTTYIATSPRRADDADWAERIREHRARRPSSWSTVETDDLPAALRSLTGPGLVDSLGSWLVVTLDRLQAWDAPVETWRARLDDEVSAVARAWTACPHELVAVTDEVGFGGIAEHRSARVFADELGRLNQVVAAASDRVLLVVAGQVLVVKDAS